MEALPEKTNRLPQTLPEKRQSAAVLLYSGTAKAIDVRRAMVELPEVAKALTPVEKYIFVASTKKQIAEIDDETGTIGRIFVPGCWICSNAIIRN